MVFNLVRTEVKPIDIIESQVLIIRTPPYITNMLGLDHNVKIKCETLDKDVKCER